MQDLPTFDELYVISDLHMGGHPDFRMLRHVERLGHFIQHLASVRPHERVALVLNGDIIDSLAEDICGYIATLEASAMMQRIYEGFAPLWDALARFVGAPSRHLIVVSGNHDIEMALPGVEYSIRQRLVGDTPTRAAAITFATHGGGYTCLVGNARVYCTHGNEVDPWNVVDYDRLAQAANALNAGRDIDHSRWVPNAGTRLVVDVINRVKAKYPFIDLIKPETELAIPLLLALEPRLVLDFDLRSSFEIYRQKRKGDVRVRGLLGMEEEADLYLNRLLGDGHSEASDASNTDTWLLEAEDHIRKGEEFTQPDDLDEGTLGWLSGPLARRFGRDHVGALRRAILQWQSGDQTFDLGHRDETCERVVERTDPSVDFIVTGHTHLERAIKLEGQRMYYNCGTWARLMKIPDAFLANDETFAKVLNVLKSGSMSALDAGVEGQSLVLERSAAVRIATEDDGVRGQLLRVCESSSGDLVLEPLPETEFFKS